MKILWISLQLRKPVILLMSEKPFLKASPSDIKRALVNTQPDHKGRFVITTEGINIREMWKYDDLVDTVDIYTNDVNKYATVPVQSYTLYLLLTYYCTYWTFYTLDRATQLTFPKCLVLYISLVSVPQISLTLVAMLCVSDQHLSNLEIS